MCSFANFHSVLQVLVSWKIYDPSDNSAAQACYGALTNAGVAVRISNNQFHYAHQKFWLIDYMPMTGSRTLSQADTAALFLSTGNWGSTDFPSTPSSQSYPPYGTSVWQKINRDINFKVN